MRTVFGLVLILFSSIGCRKPPESPVQETRQEVAKVQVRKLEPQTWHQTIRTFGVIEAAEKVTISGEISAKVKKVHFSEGQEIEAGQRLVDFDVSEQRMRYQQAEGELAGAKAKLEESRSLLKRREELLAQNAITRENVDIFRATMKNSQAKYENFLVGRSLAKHNLSRTRLVSPVSGKVVRKSIEVGEVAMPGQSLAEIHVTDTMRVVTYVTEQEINTIQVGAECSVTTPGVRGREYKAHVENWGDEADKATGNFPVKLTVKNEDGLLKAGMTAIVTLKGLEVKDTLQIPDHAVVDRNRRKVVYIAHNGKAEEVEPVLAAGYEETILVIHGLSAGDALIVGGLNNVVHGTKVDIIDSAETPKAAPEESAN